VLDHCTGKKWEIRGSTGASETLTVSNWIGPDDATANGCLGSRLNRYTLRRVAHGNTAPSNTTDVHSATYCNTIIAERFWFGEAGNTGVADHVDGWQVLYDGTNGFTAGLIMNGIITDETKSGERVLSGAFFFTDINAQGLRILNCAAQVPVSNSFVMTQTRQNCSFENCTTNGPMNMSGGLSFSALVSNNVKGAAGDILGVGVGIETDTLSGVTMTTAYPDYNTYLYTWRQWRNPNTGYETAGAYALIDELETLRLTL